MTDLVVWLVGAAVSMLVGGSSMTPVPDLIWDRIDGEGVVEYDVLARDVVATPYDCQCCLEADEDNNCTELGICTCYSYDRQPWAVVGFPVPQPDDDECPGCVRTIDSLPDPGLYGWVEYCVRGVDQAGNKGEGCPLEGTALWNPPSSRKPSRELTGRSLPWSGNAVNSSNNYRAIFVIAGGMEG